MKTTWKLKFVVLLLFVATNINAQTPKTGKYQSADGRFVISISITTNGEIEVTEPNKVSVYKKDGNYYRHTEPKYSAYLIRVGSANEIYTSKEGISTEYKFNWVSSDELSAGGCALYDKYLKKSEEADGNEIQAWAFCAAAAQAKCNYTGDGFRAVVQGVVAALKPIMLDKKCPCEDVIPKDIWDAN